MFRCCFVVLFIVGCGGGSSPVEKCDDLVDIVCERAVECLPGAGTHGACVQEVQQVIPCGSAKQVSASYDRCMNQLEAASCSVLFPTNPQSGQRELVLPADCMSVILAREGIAPPRDPFAHAHDALAR